MADGKFFSSTKGKGEIYEIKADLNGDDKGRIKDAVKKVIASMTIGKDVSSLFADVLKNMQTDDVELKKLIYLYLMNYAKTQPELTILAVNTFVKDSEDRNPLIRALAIRTMGCIRVDKIVDYLSVPLNTTIKDQDPYVRKTAVIAIAKLFDLNPGLAESNGFLDSLREAVNDDNPMVVANAVAALTEINEETNGAVFQLSPMKLNKLLTTLNEANEWGQIFILDFLARYKPANHREAESICERVLPRLTHANGSVMLSAVRVILCNLELLESEELKRQLYTKLAPPLVTLLSSEPEIQYVALRNINLILRKFPNMIISQDSFRVFFCKYNDAPYVKLEKLDIIVRLANMNNVDNILSELKEYATEVDVSFVRKAVQAIGRVALKLDRADERCVATLLDLIKTRVSYVVQEAIVVIKDIFRKYPNRYESVIPILCENLETLDEPDARASMIWIIGEYGERIENAGELLAQFIENFSDEHPQVQLQLLTATVKLFLKRPQAAKDLVHNVLKMATTGSENPDLRDRGYIYWRLLSSDPAAAKAIVLSEKMPISGESDDNIKGPLLNDLIAHIGTLASVYFKPTAQLGDTSKVAPLHILPAARTDGEEREEESSTDIISEVRSPAAATETRSTGLDLLDLDDGLSGLSMGGAPAASAPKSSGVNDLLDLLGDMGSAPAPAAAATPAASMASLFGMSAAASTPATASGKQPLLTAQQGRGLEVLYSFARRNQTLFMDMRFTNAAAAPMSDFAISFNKNSFAITPASPLQVSALGPNQSVDTSLPLNFSGQRNITDPLNQLQIAIKNNIAVHYATATVPLEHLFTDDGAIAQNAYMPMWTQVTQDNTATFSNLAIGSAQSLQEKLQRNNVFVVGSRKVANMDTLYTSVKVAGAVVVLVEIAIHPNLTAVKVNVKTPTVNIIPLFLQALEAILKSPI